MNAIRDALPAALAIAISAAPILVIVLMLVTTRPARVAWTFLAGWALGIATAASIIVVAVDVSVPRGRPTAAGALARVLLGIGLLALAVRSWRRRAAAGTPKWMTGAGSWSAARALAIAFALGAVNPKNLALTAAGMSSVLDATDLPREQAAAVAVFAVIASLSLAIPILLGTAGGPRIRGSLSRAGEWMTANGKTISVAVLAAIGIVLVVGGVRVLRA